MAALSAGGGTFRKLSQALLIRGSREMPLDLSLRSPFLFASNTLVANRLVIEKVSVLLRTPKDMFIVSIEELHSPRTDYHFHLECFPFPYDPQMAKLRVSSNIHQVIFA